MINFLKYIAGKKLSLTEYPVLTIIYMDTRFKGASYRTIRGFTENTPFTISSSAVQNAINSLIERGIVEKGIDQKLGIFYLAKDINKESELSFLNPEEKEKKPKVSRPRKEFVKPNKEDVTNYMRSKLIDYFGDGIQENFVQQTANQFYDYWENLNWSDSKGKIKSVNNRIAYWAKNRAREFGLDAVPFGTKTALIEDVIKAIYSIFEPMRPPSEIEWKTDKVQNLIEEQARAFYAQMTKKNWRLNVGCKTWQDQLQVFAADMNCPLRVLNPGYIPKNKQEREYYNMLYGGARNIDPISEKGLETVKDIFSILDEKDAEEKARIEQRKKDIVQ